MLGLIKNFFIALGNLLKKPRTVVYPKERIIIPENSRGVLHLKLDPDTLGVICSGCGLCSIICPQKCIRVKKRTGEDGKEILDEFHVDLGRCIFCGNCVESCKIGAIDMSYQHQLAEYKKKDLVLRKSELIKPSSEIRDFW
ncbi:MAG: 4Fe-4S dicluster domain-containing protein [Actinomycetota bacterium]|nr:4Fe-4S dicluster domain-containing protein [Actinomycetota bacterium]